MQPTAVNVEPVGSQSPAGKAGLVLGDLIYAVNNIPIQTQEDLIREIELIGPGRPAKLQIYRANTGQWLSKIVVLSKWPVRNSEDIIATRHRHEWNHIVIDYATARYDFFGQQYRPAVLITHTELAQVRVGDFITHVDDQPVRSPEEFDARVKGKTPGTVVKLRLQDRTVTVRIPD